MWIFLNNAFLSIVSNHEYPHNLTVRARAKGDIERVFPRAKVMHTPGRDYAFRAYVPRKVVGGTIGRLATENTATNFKDSVKEQDRHDAYLDVWTAMMRFQSARRDGGRGQGLYRKRQIQRTVWEGLPKDEDDDLDEGQLGMPDWEPKKRMSLQDEEDRIAWDFMQRKGWVSP